ncbi:MAG: hypothetical protein E6R05_06745 [Candidatus Moraniibacteriota bacterium]|nr:MAG: hypothetical protein E6R05_06745 [Candidatus Moranbacteria bacterium]
MSHVHTALEELIGSEVSLSSPQISQGSKSHNYIRQILGNKSETMPGFPRLLVDADFLSGSYARGTKNYPLDDIDVMMVMDGTGLFAWSKGQLLDAEVNGTGERSNPILRHLDHRNILSSKKVLQLFHDALKKSHPSSRISKDNQAVNVWLESYKLGIDIVPAFHIQPRNGAQDLYYIPAGGEDEGWLKTNPKVDSRISEMFVQKHGEDFKNLVRLIKYWNDVYNAGRLRSYHLETVIWYVFINHEGRIANYEQGLRYFFQNCAKFLTGPCPDATQIGDPVDRYLNPASRSLSLQRVETVCKALRSAELSNILKPGSGISYWGRIFNKSW